MKNMKAEWFKFDSEHLILVGLDDTGDPWFALGKFKDILGFTAAKNVEYIVGRNNVKRIKLNGEQEYICCTKAGLTKLILSRRKNPMASEALKWVHKNFPSKAGKPENKKTEEQVTAVVENIAIKKAAKVQVKPEPVVKKARANIRKAANPGTDEHKAYALFDKAYGKNNDVGDAKNAAIELMMYEDMSMSSVTIYFGTWKSQRGLTDKAAKASKIDWQAELAAAAEKGMMREPEMDIRDKLIIEMMQNKRVMELFLSDPEGWTVDFLIWEHLRDDPATMKELDEQQKQDDAYIEWNNSQADKHREAEINRQFFHNHYN